MGRTGRSTVATTDECARRESGRGVECPDPTERSGIGSKSFSGSAATTCRNFARSRATRSIRTILQREFTVFLSFRITSDAVKGDVSSGTQNRCRRRRCRPHRFGISSECARDRADDRENGGGVCRRAEEKGTLRLPSGSRRESFKKIEAKLTRVAPRLYRPLLPSGPDGVKQAVVARNLTSNLKSRISGKFSMFLLFGTASARCTGEPVTPPFHGLRKIAKLSAPEQWQKKGITDAHGRFFRSRSDLRTGIPARDRGGVRA